MKKTLLLTGLLAVFSPLLLAAGERTAAPSFPGASVDPSRQAAEQAPPGNRAPAWSVPRHLPARLPLEVRALRCEYLENPLGMDVRRPLLGWQLASPGRGVLQSAYEIRVAADAGDLAEGRKLLWNSGRVESDEQVGVLYAGKPLKPFTRYWWQVRVWDQRGSVSPWSEPAWWETSMMAPADWQGTWIGDGTPVPATEEAFYEDEPAPLLRKAFRTEAPVRCARLYIAGLGYYEASLNGRRVGDRVLDPGWTNFGKDVLYSTYDVTSLLDKGDNVLGVMLGNGFYNPLPMRVYRPLRETLTIGRPCVLAQLRIEYADGRVETVATDGSWKTAPGPVRWNNVYIGERYDARHEIPGWDTPAYDDSAWASAAPAAVPPAGGLKAQMQPPVRATRVLKPVRMTETVPGEFVFDMGQNMAGVVRLRVKGPAGTTVRIRAGEDVYSDGRVNVMTTVSGQLKTVWGADRSAPGRPQTTWQEDTYTLKGDGEEVWSPRFTFHGFRYLEITGWPGRPTMDDIEAVRLNADLRRTGRFECSDSMLNRLEQVLDHTFLSNVFSVQSDCPAREKFGYGGDIVGVARTFCWYYDMENFYRKAVRDFANDQRPSGGMTETAPYNGIDAESLGEHSGPIGWQLAFGFVQKQLYEYYGDKSTLEAYYPVFKKQVEFLRSKAQDHIIDRCINDHESLEERIPALFATAHYYHHVILLQEFAELTGRADDAKEYGALAAQIKQAFIGKFVQPGTGVVGNATQGAQAFALYYDLLPEADRQAALRELSEAVGRWDNHIACGIFGVPALLTVLEREGLTELAYDIVTQKTFPGWGHMLESGATTLWETWKYSDNVYSHNHPMFGSVGEWFYQTLAGIRPSGPGFSRIDFRPQPAGELSWVKCGYESVRGEVASHWQIEDGRFILEVTVPAGATGRVWLPAGPGEAVTESGRPVDQAEAVASLGYDGERACYLFEVGSGTYRFETAR